MARTRSTTNMEKKEESSRTNHHESEEKRGMVEENEEDQNSSDGESEDYKPVNQECLVRRGYKAVKKNELSVKKGEIVYVVMQGKNWCKVSQPGNPNITKCVPTHHLELPPQQADESFTYGQVSKPSQSTIVSSESGAADESFTYRQVSKPSQSVIVSGESVAGMTESAKYLLRYLWDSAVRNKHTIFHGSRWVGVFLILLVSIFCYSFNFTTESSQGVSEKDLGLIGLEELEKQYPDVKENLWITVEACLSLTLSKNYPCIILLMIPRKSDYPSLDRHIAAAAARTLHIDPGSVISIGSDLPSGESGAFFENTKRRLESSKVMLVRDLEDWDTEVVQKLHSICDAYTPAVEGAIVVMRFNIGAIEAEFSSNDAEYALNLFVKLWTGKIKDDLIKPLVTRFTENAVLLENKT